MKLRLTLSASAIAAGLIFSCLPSLAEKASSSSFKVLASEESGFNVMTVEFHIQKGEEYFLKNDLARAEEEFITARKMSLALLSFYRDIANSFKGLDVRIPREMNGKNRQAIESLAKANLRLASVYRKKQESGTAVPLLVEALKIMTPAKPEGQEAYQALIELGFVETSYRGAKR